MIRGLCCKHDHNNDETKAVITSLKNLLYYYQKREGINDKYHKEFDKRVKFADDFDTCVLGKCPCLIINKLMKMYNKAMEEALNKEIETCEKIVKKEVMGTLLLNGADKCQYWTLKATPAQQMLMGTNQYN